MRKFKNILWKSLKTVIGFITKWIQGCLKKKTKAKAKILQKPRKNKEDKDSGKISILLCLCLCCFTINTVWDKGGELYKPFLYYSGKGVTIETYFFLLGMYLGRVVISRIIYLLVPDNLKNVSFWFGMVQLITLANFFISFNNELFRIYGMGINLSTVLFIFILSITLKDLKKILD